ncbi:hypothetical protein NPIL_533281 [Nephila pilipes]|uniref:Uncharacterized protein n=1 Tax=Nephila pilipes TaxID=299642 RepID=A0A8X6Q646_NEPPI|nr:hypothetical protein NPIL_533281 [Nephila pilipes]
MDVSSWFRNVDWGTSPIQVGRILWCPINVPGQLAPPADACGSKQAVCFLASNARRRNTLKKENAAMG